MIWCMASNRQQRRAKVREEIAEYAEQVAGRHDDLDTDLERAALESWLTRYTDVGRAPRRLTSTNNRPLR
jgi:hypothetical protein